MTNLFYELLKADNGYQVIDEQLKLAYEQNLGNFLLAKDYEFPISSEDRANQLMRGKIRFEILKYDAITIAEKFDSLGIDYRFIKGLAIAMTYPMPFTRTMGDFDILVKDESIEKAADALREIGYQQEHNDYSLKDIAFTKVGSTKIELHRTLFAIINEEFYKDYLDIFDLIWVDESFISIDGHRIKVPNPHEHIKFIMLHFFRHFTECGCGVRFLLDILYFTKHNQIDLNKVKGYFSKNQPKKFAILIENMLSFYFNYEIHDKHLLTEAETNEVEIAGDFLLFDGVFGHGNGKSETTWLFLRYKRQYKESTFKMVQKAVFPGREMLGFRFSYAKKMPFLLPIAWVHRLAWFVFGERSLVQKLFFLSNRNEILEYKEAVLKQLGYYWK